jgi:hypothetical protein
VPGPKFRKYTEQRLKMLNTTKIPYYQKRILALAMSFWDRLKVGAL